MTTITAHDPTTTQPVDVINDDGSDIDARGPRDPYIARRRALGYKLVRTKYAGTTETPWYIWVPIVNE